MAIQTNGRPDPDPTVLTTAQLDRSINALREALEGQLTGTREVIEARLDGMDKAIELLQRSTDKIPTFVKAEVKQLQELHEEKFNSIATQFQERDKRSEQLSIADKTAINAALAAQEKQAIAQTEGNTTAATKQEAAFTKQIDNIVALFTKQIDGIVALLQANTSNSDKQIQDLKGRFDKGEGVGRGLDKSADRTSVNIGLIISGVGGFLGFVGAIAAVVAILSRGPQNNGGVMVPAPLTVTPLPR